MKTKFLPVIMCVCAVLMLTSCGKRKSPGQVNFSFELPGGWKRTSVKNTYIYLYGYEGQDYLKYWKENDKSVNAKMIGYVNSKKPYNAYDPINSCVVIKTVKKSVYEKMNEVQINSTEDFFNSMNTNAAYSTSSFKVDGHDVFVAQGIATVFYIAEPDYLHTIILSVDDEDGMAIYPALKSSLKFNTHGIKDGLVDGIFFAPKAILRIFSKDIRLFATANNGASYIASFIIGILIGIIALFVILGSN